MHQHNQALAALAVVFQQACHRHRRDVTFQAQAPEPWHGLGLGFTLIALAAALYGSFFRMIAWPLGRGFISVQGFLAAMHPPYIALYSGDGHGGITRCLAALAKARSCAVRAAPSSVIPSYRTSHIHPNSNIKGGSREAPEHNLNNQLCNLLPLAGTMP